MPDEDKMTIDERYKYLRIKQKQYIRASRSARSRMLDFRSAAVVLPHPPFSGSCTAAHG